MKLRSNNILKDNSATDLSPAWAGSYQVVALPVGAVASASSSGTTATVKAGHGFAVGDKALIYSSGTGTFVAEALSSVTGTTLVWSSATPTIADGDLICNLGPDTASGATPNYDASPMKIFNRADVSDAISASTVTSDSQGDYEYWTEGDGANWELVLDASGTVVGVVPGWAGVTGRLNPCDFGCIGDNSTDNQPRMQVCFEACANSKLIFYGPPGDFRIGAQLLLDADFKADNADMFRLVREYTGDASKQSGCMVASRSMVAAATNSSTSDDNIIWRGGRMTVAAYDTYGGGMICIHSDDGEIADLIIEDWGSDAVGGTGIGLGGDNGWVRNCKVTTIRTAVTSDGIDRFAGDGGGIVDCVVKSPDDCYTTSVWFGDSISNKPVSNMIIANCYGECTSGARIFNAGTGTGGATTASVSHITVSNLSGKSVGPAIQVNIGNASDTGIISDITFSNINVECDTGDNGARSLRISGEGGASSYQVKDVTIDNMKVNITGTASPTAGSIYIREVDGGAISNCSIDASGIDPSCLYVLNLLNTKKFNVTDNIIRMSSTAATTAVSAIQLDTGSTLPCYQSRISGNTIIDLPANGTGISLTEATGCTAVHNTIIPAGTGPVKGIADLGGTVEGDNVVCDNNLAGWLVLEAADNAAASTSLTNAAIQQLNEGDSVYSGNLGHNLVGFSDYTASTTQTQAAGTFLSAGVCYVSTVGTAGDAVTLPYAFHGRLIEIHNATGNSLQIFPAKSDAIDGGSVDASVNLTNANSPVILRAANATSWIVVNGATLT